MNLNKRGKDIFPQERKNLDAFGKLTKPLQLQFDKVISSLTLVPDSDILLVSLYRDMKIRVFGIL